MPTIPIEPVASPRFGAPPAPRIPFDNPALAGLSDFAEKIGVLTEKMGETNKALKISQGLIDYREQANQFQQDALKLPPEQREAVVTEQLKQLRQTLVQNAASGIRADLDVHLRGQELEAVKTLQVQALTDQKDKIRADVVQQLDELPNQLLNAKSPMERATILGNAKGLMAVAHQQGAFKAEEVAELGIKFRNQLEVKSIMGMIPTASVTGFQQALREAQHITPQQAENFWNVYRASRSQLVDIVHDERAMTNAKNENYWIRERPAGPLNPAEQDRLRDQIKNHDAPAYLMERLAGTKYELPSDPHAFAELEDRVLTDPTSVTLKDFVAKGLNGSEEKVKELKERWTEINKRAQTAIGKYAKGAIDTYVASVQKTPFSTAAKAKEAARLRSIKTKWTTSSNG
jgi:hypothetical protein